MNDLSPVEKNQQPSQALHEDRGSSEFITFHKPGQVSKETIGYGNGSNVTEEKNNNTSPFSGSTIFGEPKNLNMNEMGDNLELPTGTGNNHYDPSSSPSSLEDELLFFNYHEYSVQKYECLETGVYAQHSHPLTITHFPNPYVEFQSKQYRSTRIVRIPRIFNKVIANTYPQFSTTIPGFEPAALIDPKHSTDQLTNVNSFIPKGIYQGQLFGYSSVSPLSQYLTVEEFKEIVERVNEFMKNAFDPLTVLNIINNILNFMTIWTWERIIRSPSKACLDRLEAFIEDLNNNQLKTKDIRIISPRRSGYICLDFEIPKPVIP
ncbi:Shr5 protein [Saccharomycopsis crataegensis]|uniref:Ras modification protein ERF4 n=1 Tax=Saccharomycopsis crataegensis TaxID=43959 RepID=A0AAV5QGR2_9ASCO|nr:Shr5 protein [Saccharomycopsis crataegensis]